MIAFCGVFWTTQLASRPVQQSPASLQLPSAWTWCPLMKRMAEIERIILGFILVVYTTGIDVHTVSATRPDWSDWLGHTLTPTPSLLPSRSRQGQPPGASFYLEIKRNRVFLFLQVFFPGRNTNEPRRALHFLSITRIYISRRVTLLWPTDGFWSIDRVVEEKPRGN